MSAPIRPTGYEHIDNIVKSGKTPDEIISSLKKMQDVHNKNIEGLSRIFVKDTALRLQQNEAIRFLAAQVVYIHSCLNLLKG
jgi:hypothetical protein